MALFGAAGRSVKLYFEGDSTNLERTLIRTETRLKRFERVAGKQSTLNSGLVGGFSKGGAITAGLGLAVLGIKNVTDAAENAQVILGQTSVAVEDAGLSWAKYGDQVQAASLSIAKSSAFDDEAVMQSFALLVRGQKDVGKALELSQLSADVARGRYTDLASATQLVNKAAMGQIGALRRAGIQIDKNATSTQALTALQAAYGGAAVRYANSAAGAQDKLSVSVENLRESLGKGLLPVLKLAANDADTATKSAGLFGGALKRLGVTGDDVAVSLQNAFDPGMGPLLSGLRTANALFDSLNAKARDFTVGAKAFNNSFGLPALTAAGENANPTKGFKVVAPNGPTTGVSTELHNEELDARLSGNRLALKAVLAKEAQSLQVDLKSTLPEDQAPLKEALLGVTDEIKSIDDQIIQDANDKKQAVQDAAAQMAASKQKAIDALKAQAQAFKDQADAIKSAVLDSFDTKTAKINNARALADASKALRVARQIGGPEGIKLAQRDFTDAQRAVQRQQIEDRTFRVTEGPKGPVNTLRIGEQTINVYTNDPKAAAREVVKLMAGGSVAPQQRGRVPGRGTY